MKKICVILVNYNGAKYNDKCINSILRSTIATEIQIVVVDNASTDDSLNDLYNMWGQNKNITIISLDENYGFSKANNVGIEWARKEHFEYFLLLNNDTEVAEDAIEHMVNEQKKTGAIVVPKILYADRPDIIWCAGGNFSKLIWKPLQRGLGQKDRGQYNQNEKCDFANGCAMLISEDIVKEIGFLDERFFLYYEDVEYSLKARRQGIPVWYCSDALIYHKVNGSTSGNQRPDNAYYITRNWILCNKDYMGKRFFLFKCYFALNRLAWIVIWSITNMKDNVIATIKGIKDYRMGIFGRYHNNNL